MLGVAFHEVEEGALGAALRREDFDFVASAFGKSLFEQFTVVKIRGDVNRFRQILRFQIELLQKRGHELPGIKLFQFLPVKFATIDDAPAAQMKKVGGNESRFRVVGKNVGIVS